MHSAAWSRRWEYIDCLFYFFFFNDTATTEIYTLSLHDALPIYLRAESSVHDRLRTSHHTMGARSRSRESSGSRSEEHTSELQSQSNLVCRLLLEKKKKNSSISLSLRTSTFASIASASYTLEQLI